MRNEKENYYIRQILTTLLNGEIVSTSKLSELVGLSEKSIRNKLASINDYLVENEFGIINKKPRVGIWLEASDEQKELIASSMAGKDKITAGYDPEERMFAALKIFFHLREWETITTQKLSDDLFLSAPTALKVIRECEEWLAVYNIKIVNERNRGFRLEYRENEYRLALKNLIVSFLQNEERKELYSYFFGNMDIDLIRKCIMETENAWNYRFTDESFEEILIYCCIAYQRRDIQIPDVHDEEVLRILQKYNEYPFTVAIFKKMHEKFHVIFSNEDVMFLAIQIMCSKFIGVSSMDETLSQVMKYDNKLMNFIDKMLGIIGSILDVDLSSDGKLRKSLVLHLRTAIFRIRYGIPQSNSMIHFIKNEYKNVFRATWAISILFEETYRLQITEDEIGYIVLYIQSALERRTIQYKALLLTDGNLGHAQLLSERVKKMVPEIKVIEMMSYHDFHREDMNDVDIVITQKDLNIEDKRIIKITNLLSDAGRTTLRNYVDTINIRIYEEENPFSPECFPLFSPELMFTNVDFKTKEDVLKYMSDVLEARGYVTADFFESVMEREKMTTTSIGNGVSLPHGAQVEVKESKVAIAVLNRPILWDDDQVEIVFLLAFKMNNPEEVKRIQMFYKQYISLVETDEKVKRLKEMKSNLDLYKYLIQ